MDFVFQYDGLSKNVSHKSPPPSLAGFCPYPYPYPSHPSADGLLIVRVKGVDAEDEEKA